MFGFEQVPPSLLIIPIKMNWGKRTTKDLIEDCLHKYVITDAIKDENVLKFAVEYVGKYKRRDTATEIDIEVEDIDTQESMEDPGRLERLRITSFLIMVVRLIIRTSQRCSVWIVSSHC